MISPENHALIAKTNASLSTALYALSQGGRIGNDALSDVNRLLDAAREEGRGDPWPISTDGPNRIDSHRRWLARQLLDSKLTDEQAYSIVRHSF